MMKYKVGDKVRLISEGKMRDCCLMGMTAEKCYPLPFPKEVTEQQEEKVMEIKKVAGKDVTITDISDSFYYHFPMEGNMIGSVEEELIAGYSKDYE